MRWLLPSGVVAAGAAGALVWVAFFSTWLSVQHIQVTGTHRLARSTVVHASAVPPGLQLARVDFDAVRTRVTGLRVVKSVQIRRAWPHTLRITVTERRPIAAVPLGSGFALLDADGVRVTRTEHPPEQLPVVRIQQPGDDRRRGARAAPLSPAATRAALRVVECLPQRLRREVRAVSVSAGGEVTLDLAHHVKVRWGTPEDSREKVRILTVLMRHTDGEDSYDVSSGEVVTSE